MSGSRSSSADARPIVQGVNRQRYVHRTRSVQLPRPGWIGPLTAAGAVLAVGAGFGVLCAVSLHPAPHGELGKVFLGLTDSARHVLATVGFINGILSMLALTAILRRMGLVMGARVGLHPVVESEGCCRIIQDAGGHWGLELLIDPAPAHLPFMDSSLRTRDFFRAPEPPSFPIRGSGGQIDPSDAFVYRICFRLDESSVARISRLFDPLEWVQVRWLDFPESAGGPTLLAIDAAAREEVVLPREESPSHLEAA